MDKFLFSRSYIFRTPKGRKRTHFFYLIRRSSKIAVFKSIAAGEDEEFLATIFINQGIEIAAFKLKDQQIFLEANNYLPKGYDFSLKGQKQMFEDKKRDQLILKGIYNQPKS